MFLFSDYTIRSKCPCFFLPLWPQDNLCKCINPGSAISRSAIHISEFHLLISKMKVIALLWMVAAKIRDNVPKSLGQGLQAVMKVYLFLTAIKPDLICKICSCFFTPAVKLVDFLGIKELFRALLGAICCVNILYILCLGLTITL